MGDLDSQNINDYNNLIPSSDVGKGMDSLGSISKLLASISDFPNLLRRKLRGEMLYEDKEGNCTWVQGVKPAFVQMDFITNKPKKVKIQMPWGKEKEIYVTNDEAIEEILSQLDFMGVNQINPLGYNDPENYLEDLKEFECKLAAVLALKQKEWGLDKELLPMLQLKLKTLVQDVRSLSVKGNLLKTVQTTVQRIEQHIEKEQINKKRFETSPY